MRRVTSRTRMRRPVIQKSVWRFRISEQREMYRGIPTAIKHIVATKYVKLIFPI